MAQLFVIFCCFLGCPLLMGGMMWFIGRDGQAKRLEREIRRLNRRAARRAVASDVGRASAADAGLTGPGGRSAA